MRLNLSAIASPYVFTFSDDVTVPSGGQKAKETAQNIFGQKVFMREEFQAAGFLGSHSIRKFAATHVRRCGILKDNKDTRGRWKGKTRVLDRYDDVELPYPDCKVAEKLCIGGPCYYLIDNSICNPSILTTFVLTKVVPNIRQRLPDSTCIILGKAMLWLVFSSVTNNFISIEYGNGVKADLAETGIVIADGQNPILRMPVLVSGDQGTVYINELVITDVPTLPGAATEGGGQQQGLNLRILENSTNRIGGDQMRNYMLQLQSSVMSLRRENIEIRSDIANLKQFVERGFSTVNGNIRRVAMQPVRRVTTTTGINLLAGAATGGDGGCSYGARTRPRNDEPAHPNAKTKESF